MINTSQNILPAYQHTNYLVRKKILTVLGSTFEIFDPSGAVVFYSKQKAFKLKEDIRIFTGADMQTEVLAIHARQILDFSAVYDVIDSATNTKIGALQRKGMKSILKDEWLFLDENDREIGVLQEDSMLMALLRRFLANLIPQTFFGSINGMPVCQFKQHFNPFVVKINLDFAIDTNQLLDRRLGLAAAILLCAIEGRQD